MAPQLYFTCPECHCVWVEGDTESTSLECHACHHIGPIGEREGFQLSLIRQGDEYKVVSTLDDAFDDLTERIIEDMQPYWDAQRKAAQDVNRELRRKGLA